MKISQKTYKNNGIERLKKMSEKIELQDGCIKCRECNCIIQEIDPTIDHWFDCPDCGRTYIRKFHYIMEE